MYIPVLSNQDRVKSLDSILKWQLTDNKIVIIWDSLPTHVLHCLKLFKRIEEKKVTSFKQLWDVQTECEINGENGY